MTFWTYMLRCADGSYYVGQTSDLERRLGQHQSGEIAGYTQDRRPVVLVWSETFQTRDEARAAEHRIKPWSRAKKEALIAGDWSALRAAAIPPSERETRASAPLGEAPRLRSGQGGAAERQPAIVLVRPQLGENIGKAARAMLNFGLTDLRLVAPRDGWPNPDAGPAASGADAVLAAARVYGSVAEATADCAHVYATTVRKRGVSKPVVTPEQAATAMHAEPGRSAILFGPERSGLETDDVAVARTIVTVPINPEFGSLNLAQAVILVAYEWSKGVALASPPATDRAPPAPQAELDGMIAHLDGILERAGYYFPPDRAHVDKRALRTILTSPGWNAGEVRTLRGVLRSIERALAER
ncbi:TrmH family RNA methyltransferase [Sphingomonas profundi]|uniref:TrmH family RNA methyltransferase n=1 Tax=Alterirhizorhabdus profundi TaxID=2681549 RepID=UPI0012E80CDE|nr:TrmH family RNA methyltransferase [Sphingomonas profundi]